MVLREDNPHSLATLVRVLADGGVAIAPGDTMYGLIGKAPQAEERLRRVKGRGEDKPFLLIIPEASWLSRFTDAPLPARLLRHWPGPLTLVIPHREGGTVAVRVPDSPFLCDLVRAVGSPLYSTSVNRAGSPPIQSVRAMIEEFEADVDAIFDGGDHPPGPPSTLVDVTRAPYTVLRQGALTVPPEDLQ